jgi:signal transduction histidine kinase
MRARVEERADERVQIARDLHDTLLQGIQGLLLNVHVATQKIPGGDEAKPMLERALSTADRIIIEGRNRISALRSEHVTDAELSATIESICSDLSASKQTQYRVVRRGSTSLSLDSHVADEVFHIAREALTNASRHADARQIEVLLDYGAGDFELSCEDDGCGFEPDAENTGHHWGLKGMAERAAKLGGRFACRSEPMQGTRISVTIPAFRAYHPSRWIYYFRGLRSRRRGDSARA